MKHLLDFALCGGRPAFDSPLHIAQLNLPDRGRLEAMIRGVFERRYFANHGPLVAEFERRFAAAVDVDHAVCVTNATVGLIVLAAALDLQGPVVVPAFTFPATIQAIRWAGLRPLLCDVDRRTHMLSAATVAPLMHDGVAAILGVHLWGHCCPVEELEELAGRYQATLFFDACHGVGVRHASRPVGGFGVGEVFSFHATKVLNAAEGGCITTNDHRLADRLRTIRNFHASQTFAGGVPRMNAKMSEIQAGLALLSLDQLPENVAANRLRYEAYVQGLTGLDGIRILPAPAGQGTATNHQYVVAEIDPGAAGIGRDEILSVLAAENVICRRHFYPGLHRLPGEAAAAAGRSFPVTDALCSRVIQLPNSQFMTVAAVATVCALIRAVLAHAPALQDRCLRQTS
jgi:dTDP-4-amino-4,6-dideoxyglucose